jgi:hypothetical protein
LPIRIRIHPILLFGRMAWSNINGLLLVSGGLGMFDKETVIEGRILASISWGRYRAYYSY